MSVALGAFVAGLALAESDLADSVLGEIVPLRELFCHRLLRVHRHAAEPGVVLAGWPIVLALLLLITLGKAVADHRSSRRLDGQRLLIALRVGGLLGQSGEFSFVLATVGLELGVLRPETFSLAMGAVVLSILAAEPLLAAAKRARRLRSSRGRAIPEVPDEEPGGRMRRHAIVRLRPRGPHGGPRAGGARHSVGRGRRRLPDGAREARQSGAPSSTATPARHPSWTWPASPTRTRGLRHGRRRSPSARG